MNRVSVFVSWSGELSKQYAELLSKWLPRVIQAVEPFFSPDDISKGSFWFGEITKKLNESAIGIICLTEENKNKPWILFEAGALNKGLSANRVCPILIDLEPKDVNDPIAKFQLTKMQKDDMFKLLKTINSALGENKLTDSILEESFSDTWDKFSQQFSDMLDTVVKIEKQPQKTNDELMESMLDVVRAIDRKTDNLDNKLHFIRRGYVENPSKSDLMNLEFEEQSFVKKYSDSLKKGMGYYVLCIFCNSDGWNKANDFFRNFNNAVQCGGPSNHLSHGVLLLNDFEVFFTSYMFIADYLVKELFKLGGIYRIEVKDGYDAKNVFRFAASHDEVKQAAELYAVKEIKHSPQSEDDIKEKTQLLLSEKLPRLLDIDRDYRFHSSSLGVKFGYDDEDVGGHVK